jgi:signal transduction histidine kinase
VGGADYVDKPFQPQEVLARIAHQAKIARLQAEKASFGAMLVHDLRSPLTTVYATLGLLARSQTLAEDPELATLVGFSTEALQRTLAMIAEVLEIYRSTEAPVAAALAPGDVAPVLQRCAQAARLEANERGVTLEVNVEPEAALLAAHDALRLERAISNLLGNAFKFTPRGGRVVLDARRASGAAGPLVRIEVRDTGDGIPADVLPHIFELYRQADTRQRTAGFGLGLAIVKRIVDAHQGTISVRSEPGAGTTFTIELPALS